MDYRKAGAVIESSSLERTSLRRKDWWVKGGVGGKEGEKREGDEMKGGIREGKKKGEQVG